MTRHVTVVGSESSEHIDISACSAEIHGAGGNDFLYTFPEPTLCEGIGSEVFGDEGNDSVYGTDGRDVLRGGAGDDFMFGRRGRDDLGGWTGQDRADGGDGRDRCRAEVKQNCEA
jgi:Ca2+-binding RTX toxin-like protein